MVVTGLSLGAPGESPEWAVRLLPGSSPEQLAEVVGAAAWEPIGSLANTYLMSFSPAESDSAVGDRLAAQSQVVWEELQVPKPRSPQASPTAEPLFRDQWHHENTGQWGGRSGVDLNVVPVWESGVTGAGVGVAVVDTGTDYRHPELTGNYREGVDTWDNDSTALPGSSTENHGTAVSGIILAAANGEDGTGIAPAAGLYPVRLLRDGASIPDASEAAALGAFPLSVGVSNNSWGPADDSGVSLAPTGSLVRQTFSQSTSPTQGGRAGRGTVFVWAAGNDRELGQRADYDGYNSAPQTIAVGAIGQDGQVTTYSEPGASLFVAAPSLGAGRAILTTDRPGSAGYASGNTTDSFSGTSAAAPMVSGVVALMLEARPELTWRDVQHVIARTAVQTDWRDPDWFLNGGGFHLHEDYGFGRIDAAAAVGLARDWALVPSATSATESDFRTLGLPDRRTVSRILTVDENLSVEHVELTLNLNHSRWQQLEITLISPDGTRSVLSRPFAVQNSSFGTYTFMSVQFWGERSAGNWRVEFVDTESGFSGSLTSVTLKVHGTAASPDTPPNLERASIFADHWPLRLEPGDWLAAPAGETLELLSAVSLERGSVAQDEAGDWWFEPPPNAFGQFPISLTVATSGGAVRNFVVALERPVISSDGIGVSTINGLGGTAGLLLNPRWGSVADASGGIAYTPFSDVDRGAEADRFSLGPVGNQAEVSIPVIFDRSWTFQTDGSESTVDLGLSDVNLNGPFTIEGWVRADTWGEAETGFGRIFDKDSVVIFLNGSQHGFYPDGSLVVYTQYQNGDTGAFTTPPNSFPLRAWTHLAVTFDASRQPQVEIYLDGVKQTLSIPSAVSPPSAGTPLLSNLGVPASMGDNAARLRALAASFADFRIWSSVRSGLQIAAAAERSDAPAGSTLLARLDPRMAGAEQWPMAGTAGQTAALSGVQWSPFESPWETFRMAFPDAADTGGGWWQDPVVGRVFGDNSPWIYLDGLGWLWTSLDPEGDRSRWFYRIARDQGWLYWTPDYFPWMYSYSASAWVYNWPGTRWFYYPTTDEWTQIN